MYARSVLLGKRGDSSTPDRVQMVLDQSAKLEFYPLVELCLAAPLQDGLTTTNKEGVASNFHASIDFIQHAASQRHLTPDF